MSKLGATISTLTGALVLGGAVWAANDYLRSTYADKEGTELLIAQSAAEVQRDITAVRLQQMRWELEDIVKRMQAGNPLPGDASRRIELEARIKKLAGQ